MGLLLMVEPRLCSWKKNTRTDDTSRRREEADAAEENERQTEERIHLIDLFFLYVSTMFDFPLGV